MSKVWWFSIAFVVIVAGATTAVLVRAWHGEVSIKAITKNGLVSLAGGLELFGVSASLAAIFGGPGVIAVHFRSREIWRRTIARVDLETLLAFLDQKLDERRAKEDEPPGFTSRLATRVLDRTDKGELPALGLGILFDLREPTLSGTLTCGFSDPDLTGKAAAVLYPVAALLAPLGTLDVRLDWSGKNVIEGTADFSFRVILGSVVLLVLRFIRRHVHLRPVAAAVPLSLTI